MFKKDIYLYLDDVRIPKDDRWEVVTNYDEFVAHINLHGLENYECISLDHDLGEDSGYKWYPRGGRYNKIREADFAWADQKKDMVKIYFLLFV